MRSRVFALILVGFAATQGSAECFGPLCNQMHRMQTAMLALEHGGFPIPRRDYDPLPDLRDMEAAATIARDLPPTGADEKAFKELFDKLIAEIKAYEADPGNKIHFKKLQLIEGGGHARFAPPHP